ncbi:MAG: SAM-dependent methyltransferase, partial [Actinomycetota bacterium]
YEHCSYVDETGFNELLRTCGFDPVRSRLDYQGQYLVVHARLAEPSPMPARAELPDFAPLAGHIDHWRAWATTFTESGGRAAVWAASSKAVAFLSAVPEFEPLVAVDINPAKAGRHLPGSGLGVVAPADLAPYDVDTIVVMNPIYLEEIGADLAQLGIDARLIGLGA